jgi:hypothetical protein
LKHHDVITKLDWPASGGKPCSIPNTASRAINACLSPTGQHEQLDFILGDAIGGLSSYMSESHKQRIKNEIAGTPGGKAAAGPTNTGKPVSVDCWPLHAMMAALGKTRIDYLR